jgi:hypothetical protein
MKVQRATADVDRATPMTNKHAISPHDTTQQREAMSKAIARETNTWEEWLPRSWKLPGLDGDIL